MALERATYSINDADLEFMVLGKGDLPSSFQGHQVVREGILDNEMMAESGFANSTAQRFSQAGRITGFMREFGPTSTMASPDGFNFLAATVAHLFDKPESVVSWMNDVFLKDFQDNVGESVGGGYQLISTQPLTPQSFFRPSGGAEGATGRPVWAGVFHRHRLSCGPNSRRGVRSHRRRPRALGPSHRAGPGPGEKDCPGGLGVGAFTPAPKS